MGSMWVHLTVEVRSRAETCADSQLGLEVLDLVGSAITAGLPSFL